MKRYAGKKGFVFLAVEPVAQQGVSYVSHMHADLVGSACFKLQFEEGIAAKPL